MLADFDIPALSNDMKIAGQKKKNSVRCLILYKNVDPCKKRRPYHNLCCNGRNKFSRQLQIWYQPKRERLTAEERQTIITKTATSKKK